MTTIPESDALFDRLMAGQDHWLDVVEVETADKARFAWARRRVDECGFGQSRYGLSLTASWAHLRSPLPIGLQAFHEHGYLKHRYQFNPEVPERLAILPGNEYLYLPVAGVIHGTRCEALCLSELDGDEWIASTRVAYRITGDAGDDDVQEFVKRARQWWWGFSGKPLPVGGRPAIEITYDDAAEAWSRMRELEAYEDKRPTHREFLDFLTYEFGIEMSEDTFRRRRREWGLPWPPKGGR